MPQSQASLAPISPELQKLLLSPMLPNDPLKLKLRQPPGMAVKPLLLFFAWSLPTLPAVTSVFQPDVAAMDLAISLTLPS
jgi:hypothetical protein